MPRFPSSKSIRRAVLAAPLKLPDAAIRVATGGTVRRDGLELDTQMGLIAKFLSLGRKPFGSRPIGRVRAEFESLALDGDRPEAKMARTVQTTIRGGAHSIPVTILVPFGVTANAPAVVYYHGGGFVLGSRRTTEGLCRRIADETKAIVVNVEYRLAPEHPFPAAVDDAIAAYRWAVTHGRSHGIDPKRVAVAGDSAGGCLAAVTAILARDERLVPPKAQWLIYPLTKTGATTPSRAEFAEGFGLEATTIAWFHAQYHPVEPGNDLRASPLEAPSLAGLAPAFVATAGFDPLRDEGEAYGKRLEEAGVRTVTRRYPGLIHGFANMRNARAALAAVDEGIAFLRTELA